MHHNREHWGQAIVEQHPMLGVKLNRILEPIILFLPGFRLSSKAGITSAVRLPACKLAIVFLFLSAHAFPLP